MITDYGISLLCQALYNEPNTTFDHIFNTDEVYCGLKAFNDCTVVIFRGSTTFLDWLRDFQAAMIRTDDIGSVEVGFYIGLKSTLTDLLPFIPIGNPVQIGGHSLGGGRAHIFAALLIKAGYSVRVTTFGSPRPGDDAFKQILAPYEVNSYKNGEDYVTDVPIPIHPLLPYEHPRQLIAISAAPSAYANLPDWGLLSDHHCQLYVQALKVLENG